MSLNSNYVYPPSFGTIGQFADDNLIADNSADIIPWGVTLKAGAGVMRRGTVLGRITGKGTIDNPICKILDSGASDGSETPYGILADTVDTGDAPAVGGIAATAYRTGIFNGNALIFNGADTPDIFDAKLANIGIFVSYNVSY